MEGSTQNTGFEVAIIGISCRFPGASNWREYWRNLVNGVESAVSLTAEELERRGTSPQFSGHKNFVNVVSELSDKDCFDAPFFNYSKDEAHLMNPQTRVFHECVWEALEDAGCNPDEYNGNIGIYAGASDDLNWRLYTNLINRDQKVHDATLRRINNKDFMPTLIAYKLGLKGPSMLTQTTCSSSLTSVHVAYRALLLGEVSMALAGGISLSTDVNKGHLYEEGSIFTKDGHCRAFDRDATGTYNGEGVGIVVMKRLKDALSSGDHIYAVIKGTAINNDGKRKLGYTTPSAEGQYECIRMAQKFAKVEPESIGYVEAHGTATGIGDAIEVEALNRAFKNRKEPLCEIGSVKTNIGHLDTAAGIAGLIKAALSLKHKQIPPSLHYKMPNGEINFNEGPFRVTTELKKWEHQANKLRRAGVSSFGLGGANAHVILEEIPEMAPNQSPQEFFFLPFSAKTENSLRRFLKRLQQFLMSEEEVDIRNISHTLLVGRKQFEYRKFFIAHGKQELLTCLEQIKETERIARKPEGPKRVVFTFSGLPSQSVRMARGLYLRESVFKEQMDDGFKVLNNLIGINYQELFFAEDSGKAFLNKASYSVPFVFLFQYSMTKLFHQYGIEPDYLIGQGVGEYVTACLNSVFSFEDALKLIVKQGELMDTLAEGAMMFVSINAQKALGYRNEKISVASIISEEEVIFSGDKAAIEALAEAFTVEGIACKKIDASYAERSAMVEDILQSYRAELLKVKCQSPKQLFFSSLTGNLIQPDECTSVDYWLKQFSETAQISTAIMNSMHTEGHTIFVQIGAFNWSEEHFKKQKGSDAITYFVNTQSDLEGSEHDWQGFMKSIGHLWMLGVPANLEAMSNWSAARKIPLPTYSFERTRYPTEVDTFSMLNDLGETKKNKQPDTNDWHYQILWKQSVWLRGIKPEMPGVVVFAGERDLNEHLYRKIREEKLEYVEVMAGTQYQKTAPGRYQINPAVENDYEELFRDLKHIGFSPSSVFHLWTLGKTPESDERSGLGYYKTNCYESLLWITKGFSYSFSSNLTINVISDKVYKVFPDDTILPAKSILSGPVKVIPLEFQNIRCKVIDIGNSSEDTVPALWKELCYEDPNKEVAIRHKKRYIKSFSKVNFTFPEQTNVFRTKGTYLITGANGGMGQLFASHLTREHQCNLVLVSRRPIEGDLVSSLNRNGANYLFIQCDVSDKETLADGIKKAEDLLGPVNGVIHAAGLPDRGGVILRRAIEEDEKVFAPKVIGTRVLYEIFCGKQLDFFVNCSSQNSSLAHFAQVAYTSANTYLDAFAETNNGNYPVISIGWPPLKEIGMSVEFLKYLTPEQRERQLQYCVSADEAIKVLKSAIYLELPVQVISTTDFMNQLLIQNNQRQNEYLSFDFTSSVESTERPELSTAYSQAVTETERRLKLLFESFFHISDIGIKDSFFELGGDSLKAMVMIKRIKRDFNADIQLKDFFKMPNIKEIAEYLDNMRWLNSNVETVNEIVI